MWCRFPVAVLLLTAALLVGALAYADPPDPKSIGGLWNDHDYDDVVVAVSPMESSLTIEPALVTPERSVVRDIPHVTVTVVAIVPPPVASIRAPPIA